MSPITDREAILRLASLTVDALEKGAFSEVVTDGLEGLEPVEPSTNAAAAALSDALSAAHQGRGDGVAPFLPTNQALSLLQSAYDEYMEERAASTEAPFDHLDPGWASVAWEKLKAIFRGKRDFIKHNSLTDLRYDLPADATVALFSDWGTGEESAKRVMRQIKAANPTHAIHLGDVYYSGTKKEIEQRFLAVIDELGPPASSCRYFALNSNHEMYSGGFGYFDTTLPRFGQDASYFNLRNDHWQLIGLDSGHEDFGLRDPQKPWLTAQVDSQGTRRSILMTHHQMFSPYEDRAQERKLFEKTSALLPKIFAWFWGHEHKCIIFDDHLGIKARCIGHGAIPGDVPYGAPKFPIPLLHVDERQSPEGTSIHGFALLRFSGPKLDVSYIDEFGEVFFEETFDAPGEQESVAAIPGPRREAPLDAEARLRFASHYKRLLKGAHGGESESSGLESMGGGDAEPDLSRAAIEERGEIAKAALHEIVKKHLGDKPQLHEIAEQLAKVGRSSLELFGGEDPEDLDPTSMRAGLEVIVRTDGSRPSFMIQHGQVALTSSPAGTWEEQINGSTAEGSLIQALECVGRIDLPGTAQGFVGTGFLIHENLIVTNRHVMQEFARPDGQGNWVIKKGAVIDFGHEFDGIQSLRPRALKSIVFAGSKVITKEIDHAKIDLVLVELEAAAAGQAPTSVLKFNISKDWSRPNRPIYAVGYPGDPGLAERLTLLEKLFQSTFGCKRLAPGMIQSAHADVASWTLAHDATTLGGNSGSVILIGGREDAAAGLHYGGSRAEPRENWGHVLGRTLDEPDKLSGKTLLENLNHFGVQLIN